VQRKQLLYCVSKNTIHKFWDASKRTYYFNLLCLPTVLYRYVMSWSFVTMQRRFGGLCGLHIPDRCSQISLSIPTYSGLWELWIRPTLPYSQPGKTPIRILNVVSGLLYVFGTIFRTTDISITFPSHRRLNSNYCPRPSGFKFTVILNALTTFRAPRAAAWRVLRFRTVHRHWHGRLNHLTAFLSPQFLFTPHSAHCQKSPLGPTVNTIAHRVTKCRARVWQFAGDW
jgi:hypothetical protein